MADPTLFPECVLPGCTTPVVEVGTACDGCVSTGLVRHNPGGERMTAEQISARDARTRRAYEVLALIKDPELRARMRVVERVRTLTPNGAYL